VRVNQKKIIGSKHFKEGEEKQWGAGGNALGGKKKSILEGEEGVKKEMNIWISQKVLPWLIKIINGSEGGGRSLSQRGKSKNEMEGNKGTPR